MTPQLSGSAGSADQKGAFGHIVDHVETTEKDGLAVDERQRDPAGHNDRQHAPCPADTLEAEQFHTVDPRL
jgi:hypothetical protein